MAEFDNHILQAKNNIAFLHEINNSQKPHYDWQVTVCFYTALHFINAHIAKTANQHYRSHKDVDTVINPHNCLSLARLNEDIYYSYVALSNLSLRARYLVPDKKEQRIAENPKTCFIYEKHLSKAIRHLNCIISFIISEYKINYDRIDLKCSGIKDKENIEHFKIVA